MAGMIPLIYFSMITLEKSLTELLINQQMSAVKLVASEIEDKVSLRIDSLQDVADHLPTNQINDSQAILFFLSQRTIIYRFFLLGVVVIDTDGHGVVDYPVLPGRATADYRQSEYFQEVLMTGRATIGKPSVEQFSHKPVVALAVPIKNAEGDVLGVLAGFIDLSDQTIFDHSQAKFGKTGEFLLVSDTYKTIISDATAEHKLMALDQENHQSIFERCLDKINGTGISEDFHGRKTLLSDVHILSDRWVLLGALPEEEAFAPINEVKQKIYLASVLVLVIVGGLMWWMMRLQLRVVRRATRQLHKMTFGEQPLQSLNVIYSDEIGEMLQSFNQLQQQLNQSTASLEASNASFRNLFLHMSNGFALHELITDEQGKPTNYRFIDVNPAFERMTGLSKEQVIGKNVLDVIPELEKHWIERYGEVVITGVSRTFESYTKPLDRWYKLISYRPEAGKFAVIVEDMTTLKRAQHNLEHLAHHDVLTGLSNRALFAERLQLAITQSNRRSKLVAIGYIDLDKFKPVNDTFGHHIGDLLLVEVAQRLSGALRSDDVVSRLGGDEFAILLADLQTQAELEELLERLLGIIAAPYDVNGQQIEISMTMGVTIYPLDDSNPDSLLQHADDALYAAKESGRNRFKIYQA